MRLTVNLYFGWRDKLRNDVDTNGHVLVESIEMDCLFSDIRLCFKT